MYLLVLFAAAAVTDAAAVRCRDYERAADYLDTQSFVRTSRELRATRAVPRIDLANIDQARSYVHRFPAFEDLGFRTPGADGWRPHAAGGRTVGWETSNDRGSARVHLAWNRETGAHYNVEISERRAGGSTETHRLTVSFLCNGQRCSERDVGQLVERIQ
jgi:hypothetical protein